MRRRRSRYTPSSSNQIAEIVKRYGCTSADLTSMIAPYVPPLVTINWVSEQISRKPHFVIGWPNPCKAGRMSMRQPKRRGPIAGDPGRKEASR